MTAATKPRSGRDTPLSARQRAIFDFIVSHAIEHLYQPSLREIADHFGISGVNGVRCHLKLLHQKGWVDLSGKQSRAVRILRKPRITVDASPIRDGEAAR